MSRSRRRSPYFTDQQNGNTIFVKRRASRVVRDIKQEDAPQDGGNYKKESESWSIRDWSSYQPKNPKAWRK